jgi:hypothetical protein
MDRYQHLDPSKIMETADRLRRRVVERFPASGLSLVAAELCHVATEAKHRSDRIGRPMYWLRGVAFLLVVTIVAIVLKILITLDWSGNIPRGTAFLEVADAGISSLFFVGAAILFCLTLETRYKRSRALKAMQELRSLSHIIDMHQLTKDPERMFRDANDRNTPSSPTLTLTPFQLGRYLDYCSEMLSIIGKIAVIYVQRFQDPVAIDAVEQIESTTTGLSRKIWQKISLIDQYQARAHHDQPIAPRLQQDDRARSEPKPETPPKPTMG